MEKRNNNNFTYRLYGRSKGRNKKKIHFDNFKLIIDNYKIKTLNIVDKNILDIGSGFGESTLYLSKKNKKSKVIACENFFDGNYKLVNEVKKLNINNIFIHTGNVHEFLDRFDQNRYFDSIWILFPDPWPKKKHFKRRLINIYFFKQIYNLLKKNGDINIATDSKNYLKEILFLIYKLKNQFNWENQKKINWDYKNTSLPKTKYYKKAIKNGTNPFFLKLRKL